LLLAVSLALADNELNDGNVMVSFFLEKMKPKMANLFSIAMYVLAVVGIGVVTYNQAQMVVTKFYNKAASAILALPHWIIVLVLTLGFFTLFLTVLLKLIRMIANHKHLSDHKLTDEERLTQTGNPAGNNF
jgi:TRAP-type C4-dicarboxylate transport system permease small subunit